MRLEMLFELTKGRIYAMSWSVSAFGKVGAVRKEIARQFATGSKCSEPEETIRMSAAKLIDDSLAAQDEGLAVNVTAGGSQNYKDWNAKTGLSSHLSLTISPQHGFLE